MFFVLFKVNFTKPDKMYRDTILGLEEGGECGKRGQKARDLRGRGVKEDMSKFKRESLKRWGELLKKLEN